MAVDIADQMLHFMSTPLFVGFFVPAVGILINICVSMVVVEGRLTWDDCEVGLNLTVASFVTIFAFSGSIAAQAIDEVATSFLAFALVALFIVTLLLLLLLSYERRLGRRVRREKDSKWRPFVLGLALPGTVGTLALGAGLFVMRVGWSYGI